MSWVSVAGLGVAKADSETVKLHHHLTLRRARSARLEGWATPRLHPTLRDAPLRGAPQGEVMKWNMLWYQIICRSVVGSSTRIASRAARNFPDARPIQQTLASGDDSGPAQANGGTPQKAIARGLASWGLIAGGKPIVPMAGEIDLVTPAEIAAYGAEMQSKGITEGHFYADAANVPASILPAIAAL